jgi:alkyldihydroxyacetonephosphate synthase
MTPTSLPPVGPGEPTAPIPLADAGTATARLAATRVEVDDALVERLAATGAAVTVEPAAVAEASRDWWPVAMSWATEGQVAGLGAAVVRPGDTDQVAAVLALCHEARVPVTAAGGRSGVCGASVPLHGGVVLDLTAMAGIVDVDATSLVLNVLPGTFGDVLEHELRTRHGLTLGHWPQSVALSTVGGWLACRSAGQLSGRYGKIEDMVQGLDVVLADGRHVSTGGWPRAAAGPDLTQLFVGSEGTLGVITGARLRVHPAPTHEGRGAWTLPSFAHGLEAMRHIVQRGATPAVLRLYDGAEADRTYHTGDHALLLALDEGDARLVEATLAVVAEESERSGVDGRRSDDAHVGHWLERRNDVAALEALISKGYTVDTMEVTGSWAALPGIYEATLAALLGVEGTLAASAHQSHSYPSGGCLYFTFAGKVDPERRDAYYRELWDAGQGAVLAQGGALSHHHGVGLNRARFMRSALGGGFDVLAAAKQALDPRGILNPGKLGLPSPWGPVGGW